ncbi:uncharacterized protein LAESUDRAFT_738103 [Laetiporus sulphureus 93-53]|uniref:GDP/GTP exchange factor Sec2 N-terminal domain-containing protein n=1 Tax=Laetiporus sulphureus 93-53 TaxID=1314785 RepID=A0A165CYI5_9APHY|nr:uncharacterized protein LAESUDRAFT_738103 [Laetiporus sulphureus 93-53]KZT03753.1 hypothetical protein LAESUDRAFT_738103 [Laetiporus sulphureus 93-53]
MSPSHSRSHSVDTEMHELNAEADYLEEKMHIVPTGVNGVDAKLLGHNNDPDAQAMVIQSLRSQIQDLFSQVSQLNNKLVNSYDRMSDLEDELHVTTSNLRTSTLKVTELELERSQHISALNTGLLVEKDHVTSELNRLMEKATEEAAQRGQAETAREQIEKDLDDLSASLFNQANSMVAEARMARARSERKAEETERALKEAEEVVGLLQGQMQALQLEKERADRRVEDMRVTMGKGKWVDRGHSPEWAARPRLLCSHMPYQEYIAFISHLRSIRPSSQHPPAMSTLLPLPFLTRLVTEDSDPTVRLDLAPSLNWLTRRSVISAIHSGQLTVEPMHTAALLEEISPSIPGSTQHTQISCALCGTSILSSSGRASPTITTLAPSAAQGRSTVNNSWSSSLFKNSLVQTMSSSPGVLSQPSSQQQASFILSEPPTQIYIFRIDTTSSGLPVSLPLSSQQNSAQHRPTIYPLCTTKWCLHRLRTTCSMWAFIRTGVVEKIWEETPYVPPSHHSPKTSLTGSEKQDSSSGGADADKKPPVPPRRARTAIGAFWGSVQRTLSSSREAESQPSTPKENEKPLPNSPTKKDFQPPPVHPSRSALAPDSPPSVPPPLPKRNRGRDMKSRTLSVSEPIVGEGAVDEPALSHADSAEQFATPAEDVTSMLPERTESPAAIPLPPSGPSTPEPQLPAVQVDAAPEAEAPTNNASEIPPVPANKSSNVQGDATHGVSPVPPPLPRRAAARPRPVSMVVPPPVDTTPVAPTETKIEPEKHGSSAVVGEEENAKENASSTEGDAPAPHPPEEVQPAIETAASAVAEESQVQEQSMAAEPTEKEQEQAAKEIIEGDPALPEATQAPQEQSDANTAHATAADPSEENAEKDIDAEEAKSSSHEGSVDEEQGAKPTQPKVPSEENVADISHENTEETPFSPVASSTNGVVDGVEGHKGHGKVETVPDIVSEDVSISSRDAEDAALYVGDGTWEERTWKELVRLREEMLWARIGGMR